LLSIEKGKKVGREETSLQKRLMSRGTEKVAVLVSFLITVAE
jgi:hypothetical protein